MCIVYVYLCMYICIYVYKTLIATDQTISFLLFKGKHCLLIVLSISVWFYIHKKYSYWHQCQMFSHKFARVYVSLTKMRLYFNFPFS